MKSFFSLYFKQISALFVWTPVCLCMCTGIGRGEYFYSEKKKQQKSKLIEFAHIHLQDIFLSLLIQFLEDMNLIRMIETNYFKTAHYSLFMFSCSTRNQNKIFTNQKMKKSQMFSINSLFCSSEVHTVCSLVVNHQLTDIQQNL